MRKITHIVLHCTGGPQNQTVKAIQDYWRIHNGWKNPGYHFLIEASGKVHNLLPIEKVSNGVKGHNANSIHISYIGGVDKDRKPIDNRTEEQICEQINLILTLKKDFPDAIVCGHRDFLQRGKPGWKECPSFDVKSWLESVGI